MNRNRKNKPVNRNFFRAMLALLLSMVLQPVPEGSAAERLSTLEDQTAVAVTIYNADLALVKDSRRVVLEQGENVIAFREVSARIQPETALLRNLSHPEGFFTIEQNFDFDLLTPGKLLEKYVGRTVRVVRSHPQTGAETEFEAQVLAANDGVVLRMADRIETGIPGRLVFPDVPDDLRDRPTLLVQLQSGAATAQDLELSYLSGGLSWQADYVAQLAPAEDRLDLTGFVTVSNQSGVGYQNARLQFVAGDLHRVRRGIQLSRDAVMAEGVAKTMAAPMAEESLFEYHLYTLGRPTTLRSNQTKQVTLLSAAEVPVRKEYLLAGTEYYYRGANPDLGQRLKVGVFLEMENREASKLGMPLPRGIVRVYKKDQAGGVQFVGEDAIEHTPKNEKVRIRLGDAFDVTAEKTQTLFRKLAAGERDFLYESAYRIVLKNAKTELVTVKVVEPVPGDWEMLEESHPHTRESAGQAIWQIPVKPSGETVLTYRVRIRR